MSGNQPGLFSGVLAPIGEEVVEQSRRPPHAQRQARAGYGATFLTLCYVLLDVWGPAAHASPAPVFQYAWWAAAALGVMCLFSGLFGRARGPLVGGIGLCVEAAGASWLLWNRMYPAGMPVAAFMLHAIYLAALTSSLAQLASGLIAWPSGNAERAVRQSMAAKNPPIIPVRRMSNEADARAGMESRHRIARPGGHL